MKLNFLKLNKVLQQTKAPIKVPVVQQVDVQSFLEVRCWWYGKGTRLIDFALLVSELTIIRTFVIVN